MKIKRFAALLLGLLLILGSVPSARAAGDPEVAIQASADQVAPGDTVTFDIWLRGVDSVRGIMAIGTYLDVSEGLTVVSLDALSLPSGWIYRTQVDPLAFGCGGFTVYYGGDIAVGRLTCTVDEDASGQLQVSAYDALAGYSVTELVSVATTNASVTVVRHECVAAGDWKYDENHHWHECECSAIIDKAEHTYGEWNVETPATCTENGKEVRTCTVCARQEFKEIPAGHMDADENRICDACGENLCTEHEYEKIVTCEATCTASGEAIYKCKQCGNVERSEEIPALGHNWEIQSENDETIVWFCTRCGENKTENKETVDDDTEQGDTSDDTVGDNGITMQPDGSMIIQTGCETPVPVEIPVKDVKPGHVVVLINKDGTESVVSATKMTDNGLVFNCINGATVKVVNKAKSFADIKGNNWYNNAIDYVTARGIMNGMDTKTFGPGSTTTRVQVWAMLARLSGVDAYGAEWAEIARTWAVEQEITDGDRANDRITRQELVTMLYRFAEKKGETQSIESFSDASEVSGWAKDAVEWAVGVGVMKGNANNTLNPTGETTRAEMAQFFMNFIQNV